MTTPGEVSAARFAKAQAWRAHPLLKPTLRQTFPGLTLGIGAFVVYVAVEKAIDLASWKPKKADHGGHGHAKH